MEPRLSELKKTVFYELLNLAGRVFVVARYSDRAVIGRRGFTDEEMKNGIILVFNQTMNFTWDETGISASLVFETALEKCFVPVEDIVVVYSPELQTQFVVAPPPPGEAKPEKRADGSKSSSKVVKVDFQRKNQGN
ncbi:MAG: hypothetical protein HYU64_10115 [Armatimonadetes bacterium]|nr:hypothetical protein [Armatimonadota bacterium]